MQKTLNPNPQRPNQRDYLSFSPIAVFIPTLLAILLAIFGTAWRFTLAFKPQQAPNPSASYKTALKSLTVEPTFSKSFTKIHKQNNQPLKQGVAIAQHPVRVIAQHPFKIIGNARLPLEEVQGREEKRETLPSCSVLNNCEAEPPNPHSQVEPGNEVASPSLLLRMVQDLNRPIAGLVVPRATRNSTSSSAIARSSDSVGSPIPSEQAISSAIALNLAQSPENQPNHIPAETVAQVQIPEQPESNPVPDNNSTQNQAQPVSQARAVRLTLVDIVILALENNRPIKNAYLERIAQRQELAVAEDKFSPDFTPSVSISVGQFESNQTATDANLGVGATVSVKVPTGGELSFRWATNSQTVAQNGLNLNINDDPFAQNLQLSFSQPLLRGYGVDVNRASIDIARLTERVNILDLKSTLINTITDAIVAYRELIRSQERLKIAQLSLARAQESLANNRVLIEAGRLAPVDIVQSETEVARRQVSLIEAENNLAAAQLALLNILDIDKTTVIVAVDPLTVPAVTVNPDKLREIAFENQPDYLKAQVDLERTQLALLQAENNRLWDLNLNTSYGYASNNTSDVRVGLALSRKIGDLTAERDFKRSLVNKLKAENSLKEQRESLELQLVDRMRDVTLSFSQVELAKKVTQSSERQLEIAREKQRLGRDVTVFELVRLQDDLVQARNEELNAIINYLNALTRLDQTLGTTLDTWQLTIERK